MELDLEKGDRNSLTGKVWMYSTALKMAYYYTNKPETLVSEVGSVAGIDSALRVMDDIPPTSGIGPGNISPLYVRVRMGEDSIESMLRSECDVIDLDKRKGHFTLDEKANEECDRYFSLYRKQMNSRPQPKAEKRYEKEYDTAYFMRSFFIPFRTAMENGDNRHRIDSTKKNILEYSEGKRFKKDIEEMVRASEWLHIGKNDMLAGIGLYALMIEDYMTEKYEHAAKIKKQITEWRKKNKLEN